MAAAEGTQPELNGPSAPPGGSTLSFRKPFQVETLDLYWENLVLGLIGETVDEAGDILGCRVKTSAPSLLPPLLLFLLFLLLLVLLLRLPPCTVLCANVGAEMTAFYSLWMSPHHPFLTR